MIFPYRDHNPSRRPAYVTWGLIGLNILIFAAGYLGNASEQAQAAIFMEYGMQPVEIAHGIELETLLTSMFLHAGFMHLAGNMLFLWIYGDNLEDQLGHLPFLLFYLVCGVLAALAHFAADPTSPVPLVGASGAIAGVMGGYLLLFPRARIDVGVLLIVIFKSFAVPAFIVLGLWFAMQVGLGFMAGQSGVAYWAHAGGFVAGLVLIYPKWRRLGGVDFWSRLHGHPPHRPTPIPEVRRPRFR